MYEKIDRTEAARQGTKRSITVRRVDINKGGLTNPLYRSRLVAREINTYTDDELYAATPPTEMLNVMFEGMAIGGRGWADGQ